MAKTYSTIKRIQDEICALLTQSKKAMPVATIRVAVKTKRTRPAVKEDWDRQYALAVLGLLIRGKVVRQKNVLMITDTDGKDEAKNND